MKRTLSAPCSVPRLWCFAAPDGREAVVEAQLWAEARAKAAARLGVDPTSLTDAPVV